MDKAEVFEIWAPRDAIWSPWVKPVIFSWADSPPGTYQEFIVQDDLTNLPQATNRSIVVVDLPGSFSLLCGLELAKRGFRPVPLYNCIPSPLSEGWVSLSSGEQRVVVEVRPIVSLIWQNSELLKCLRLPPDAPPAFLLDCQRSPIFLSGSGKVFDNRWLLFREDVPSAAFFNEQGLHRVTIIQRGRRAHSDLRHVLLDWQDHGLSLSLLNLSASRPVGSYVAKQPSALDDIFLTWLQNGLFGNSKQGFGRIRHLYG